MPLISGNSPQEMTEDSMGHLIYQEMNKTLSPPLQKMIDDAKEDAQKKKAQAVLEGAREGWKKLAYAIASGVVKHLLHNLEIHGIKTKGEIRAEIKNNLATQLNVEFTQSNDGHGHVR